MKIVIMKTNLMDELNIKFSIVEDTMCELGDKGEKVVQNMTWRAKEMENIERALSTLDATHKVPRNPGLPREEH